MLEAKSTWKKEKVEYSKGNQECRVIILKSGIKV